MTRERTKQDLERELDFLKKRRLVDGFAAVLNTLARWGGIVALAYFGITRPIEALAGRLTTADIAVQVLANLKSGSVSTWALVAPWAVAVVAVGYGLLERRVRRNTVERLQTRIQALEKARDPGRTSSTLTRRGDTREEDRV